MKSLLAFLLAGSILIIPAKAPSNAELAEVITLLIKVEMKQADMRELAARVEKFGLYRCGTGMNRWQFEDYVERTEWEHEWDLKEVLDKLEGKSDE